MTYEIRKSGQVYCSDQTKDLGYTPATLRAMAAAGYHLYTDGKRARKKSAPGAATSKDGKPNNDASIIGEKG